MFADNLCSWSARFTAWLKTRFPEARVNYLNEARPGCDSACLLATLGLTWASLNTRVDLAVIDTIANEGCGGQSERLVQAMHVLSPDTLVMGFLFSLPKECQ